MNAMPAQEIKRRGIGAVDDLIAEGDIHIIRNNRPQHVVLSEARHRELIEAQDEAFAARLRVLLEDLQAVSITYNYRVIPTILISEKEIILLDIGSHDKAYR